jgi:hypothetical protein
MGELRTLLNSGAQDSGNTAAGSEGGDYVLESDRLQGSDERSSFYYVQD